MTNTQKNLYRDTDTKMIAGVCSGLAEYFGIDVTIIRILAVLLAFAWGSTIFAYIIMWIVVPERPKVINTTASSARNYTESTSGYAVPATPANGGSTMPEENQTNDPGAEAPKANAAGTGQGQQPSPSQPAGQQPNTNFSAENRPNVQYAEAKRGGVFFGVFLVLVGVLALFTKVFGQVEWWNLWPLFIVAGGIAQMFFPDDHGRWTPWRLIDGVITIGVGVVFLGCTTGYISWDMFWRFFTLWPVLIIAAGFGILGSAAKQKWVSHIGGILIALTFFAAAFFSYIGPGASALNNSWKVDAVWPFGYVSENTLMRPNPQDIREDRNGAKDGLLTFEGGAGRYEIGAARDADTLYAVKSSNSGFEANVDRSGSGASVRMTSRGGTNATIDLSDAVAWDLSLESGASTNVYNLRDLKVSNLTISTGASDTKLTLGKPVSHTKNVSIESGVSNMKVSIPKNTPVRITSDTGFASTNFDESLTLQADGSYQNAEYAQATGTTPVWNIFIEGGFATFNVTFD